MIWGNWIVIYLYGAKVFKLVFHRVFEEGCRELPSWVPQDRGAKKGTLDRCWTYPTPLLLQGKLHIRVLCRNSFVVNISKIKQNIIPNEQILLGVFFICECVSSGTRTLWERARVGWFGRRALKHVYIICEMNRQSRLDAWYSMLGSGVLGWPRRMVWRGRWEVGFRMGNTCTPVADSYCCMEKPILPPIKINKFILKKEGKNTQKNYTENVLMTQITTMVWSLT